MSVVDCVGRTPSIFNQFSTNDRVQKRKARARKYIKIFSEGKECQKLKEPFHILHYHLLFTVTI